MTRPSFGLRARTTLIASLMVGIAIAVGSAALVFLVTYGLRASFQSTAETRAADIALLAQEGPIPASLPGRGDALLAQVVVGGKVVASSRDLSGRGPLVDLSPKPGETLSRQLDSIPDLQDPSNQVIDVDPNTAFLVTARGVSTKNGLATVIVASSLSPLEDTVGVLVPVLLAAAPIGLALVAVATWVLTGIAFRPVKAIRDRAETISSSAPGERLPVPIARDEIHDLAETMNGMLQRIEDSSVAQRQFISDASHELKSPIAAIRTMVDVARHDPSRVDLPALLGDVAAEDQRLELLVADLLLLATADEGGLRVSRRAVDLARIMSEEVASMVPRDGVTFEVVPMPPVEAVADEARVRQLMRNLLDNAVRHARTGVWVALAEEDGTARLTISDDGPGISEDSRERVFDRFVRIDKGRGRSDGGTGLGLPVSRAIVQAHGGTIQVANPLHGGATVEVRLPMNPELPDDSQDSLS